MIKHADDLVKTFIAVLRTDPNPSYGHFHPTLPLAGIKYLINQLLFSHKSSNWISLKACIWFAIADMERNLEGEPNSRSILELIKKTGQH